MNKKLALGIALTSIVGLNASLANADQNTTSDAPKPAAAKKVKESGKCASGKCGTEKVYAQAKLKHNPQDRLVRARDGKCGLSGQGINSASTKMANGVCGQ